MLCPHLNSIRHILLFHKHPLYSYPAPQQLRLANLHHRAGFAAFAVVGRGALFRSSRMAAMVASVGGVGRLKIRWEHGGGFAYTQCALRDGFGGKVGGDKAVYFMII